MIVLDASAAVELLLATPQGAAVARRLRGETVHAPGHLDVEVVGAIRRAVLRRLIGEHEGLVAVAAFHDLPIRRWVIKPLLQRAYQLRGTHAVADGVYIALAEGLAAPLVTSDRRLAHSHGHGADIELIAELS